MIFILLSKVVVLSFYSKYNIDFMIFVLFTAFSIKNYFLLFHTIFFVIFFLNNK